MAKKLTAYQQLEQTEKSEFVSKVIDTLLYNDEAMAEIQAIISKYGIKSVIGTGNVSNVIREKCGN